jgi:hypothetical protein
VVFATSVIHAACDAGADFILGPTERRKRTFVFFVPLGSLVCVVRQAGCHGCLSAGACGCRVLHRLWTVALNDVYCMMKETNNERHTEGEDKWEDELTG